MRHRNKLKSQVEGLEALLLLTFNFHLFLFLLLLSLNNLNFSNESTNISLENE